MIGRVIHLFSTILVLALALFAYERSIEPLYGSIPTAYYLAHILYGACTIAYFAPAPPAAVSQFLLGASLCAAPTTTYWVGALTGRYVLTTPFYLNIFKTNTNCAHWQTWKS
jgi:hypothetical protein